MKDIAKFHGIIKKIKAKVKARKDKKK